MLAAGGLIAALAVIAVVALLATSGSGSPGSAAEPSPGTSQGSGRAAEPSRARPVRNATPQPDWEPHTGPVPILEYHVLGAARGGGPLSRALRRPARLPPPDGLAGPARLPGGHPRTGRVRLVRRRHPAAEAGGALVRRRLPAAVHLRAARAAPTRLGGGAQPQGRGLGPLPEQRRSDARRRLGAGRPHDPPPRPDRTRRRPAAGRSGRVAANAAARIRRPCERLLLPGGPLRPDRGRRGRSRRLQRRRPPRSPAMPNAAVPTNSPASRSSDRPTSPGSPKPWAPARGVPGHRRRRGAAWPRATRYWP